MGKYTTGLNSKNVGFWMMLLSLIFLFEFIGLLVYSRYDANFLTGGAGYNLMIPIMFCLTLWLTGFLMYRLGKKYVDGSELIEIAKVLNRWKSINVGRVAKIMKKNVYPTLRLIEECIEKELVSGYIDRDTMIFYMDFSSRVNDEEEYLDLSSPEFSSKEPDSVKGEAHVISEVDKPHVKFNFGKPPKGISIKDYVQLIENEERELKKRATIGKSGKKKKRKRHAEVIEVCESCGKPVKFDRAKRIHYCPWCG